MNYKFILVLIIIFSYGAFTPEIISQSHSKPACCRQAYVGNFIKTFKDYPPRQSAASFNLDEVLQKMQEGGGSK